MESNLSRDNLENALEHLDWADTHMNNACDDLQKASMCIPAKSSWWASIDYLIYDFAVLEEKLRQIEEEIQEALERRQQHG